jgi:hypothetical protein
VSAFREFFPQMLLDQGVIEGFSTQDHAMLERLDAVAIADILLTDLAQEPLAKAPPLSPLEFGQTLNDADKKIAANAIAEIQRIWRSSEPPEPGNVPIPDGKFPVISRGGDE